MISLIANDVVDIHSKMDESEYIKTDECKEISQALQILAKHCESLVVSGYTNGHDCNFIYNHVDKDKISSNIATLIKKEANKKTADKTIRGAETTSHIVQIIAEAVRQYNINPDAILASVESSMELQEKISNMSEEEKDELLGKLRGSSSMDEATSVIDSFASDTTSKLRKKARNSAKKKFGDGCSTLNDIRSKVEKDFGDSMFANTKDKSNIDPDTVKKALDKATGYDTKVCKMSDPNVIKPLAQALSRNLGATVVIGYVKLGESGEVESDGDINAGIQFQSDIEEISDENGLNMDNVKTVLVGTLCIGVLRNLKEKQHLPDGLISRFLDSENL